MPSIISRISNQKDKKNGKAPQSRLMNKYRYRLQHIASSIVGDFYHNKINACWEIRNLNAGDFITPMLLRRYGFTPVHGYPQEALVFSCGSLMEKVPADFSGFILGTGFMYHDSIRSFDKARILAVRGELTRNKIGAPKDTVLGDPGLLVSRFLTIRQKKRYKLGIIPHYVDKEDKRIGRICQNYNRDVLFINIQSDPLDVVQNIDKCELILSSSLHGLVFADSLGIPNIWMVLSDQVSGKGFKFRDYNSALGKDQDPVSVAGDETLSDFMARASMPSGSTVKELKNKLDHAFCLLREEVLHQ
jgi:pyruvyltransferase